MHPDPATHARPEADRWAPWAGTPPRPGQGKARGLDRGVGAATARVARRARRARWRRKAAPAQGGAGEAEPERGKGQGHGVF